MAILGVSELRNPWTDRLKIWHTRSAHRRNHVCQIFSRSVQGLRSYDTPKIAISHWLAASPLQQFALPCYTVTFRILSLFPLVQPGHSNLLADASKCMPSSSLIRGRWLLSLTVHFLHLLRLSLVLSDVSSNSYMNYVKHYSSLYNRCLSTKFSIGVNADDSLL